MKFLRFLLDKQEQLFAKGKPLERFYPLHEAGDTFFFTPSDVTKEGAHVRDAIDLKRMMTVVVLGVMPCVFMALYNTGLQANLALEAAGQAVASGWRGAAVAALGVSFSPDSFIACLVHGAFYFIPLLITTYAVGGTWEVIFSIVRKHEVNEGFFVTGMLFPLICPPTLPLWQAALGISFGVVIGKEIFGGTGMNILNPALVARAFLFFAYPSQISGELVWVAGVDGYSGATLLAAAAENGAAALTQVGWWKAFVGTIPGSMGETSTLACLLGAGLLILTRIGSWRTMAGILAGTVLMSLLFNALASRVDNPQMFEVPFYWHIVLGGWAFGAVFMATDPVSSAFTDTGKLIYGFLIGVFVVMIRVVNPAFPEGMMLAILLMNVFAATVDHFIVQRHIKRRMARNAAV